MNRQMRRVGRDWACTRQAQVDCRHLASCEILGDGHVGCLRLTKMKSELALGNIIWCGLPESK